MKFLLPIFIAIGGFFVLSASHSTAPSPDFSKGKILYKAYKCTQCHSVKAVGMEATTKSKDMLGSDLSGYKHKTKATVEELKTIMHSDMSKWDEASQELISGFKGTDEELQTILDWLGSLEAQE